MSLVVNCDFEEVFCPINILWLLQMLDSRSDDTEVEVESKRSSSKNLHKHSSSGGADKQRTQSGLQLIEK